MTWSDAKDHARKLVITKGDYIDDKENLHTDKDIIFWAEWEQMSEYNKLKSDHPAYIHKPIIDVNSTVYRYLSGGGDINSNDFKKLCEEFYNGAKQNTDPYVFGECFYYSCCRQKARKGSGEAKKLNVGDIIVFFSCTKIDRKVVKAVVDTVFVVGGIVTIENKREIVYKKNLGGLMEVVGKDYLTGVTLPTCYGNRNQLSNIDNDEDAYNVLYYGATYDKPVIVEGKKMFSFFPCRTIDGETDWNSYEGFDRPIVYDKEKNINIIRPAKETLCERNITCNSILKKNQSVYDYWQSLASCFWEQGYYLGFNALAEKRVESKIDES